MSDDSFERKTVWQDVSIALSNARLMLEDLQSGTGDNAEANVINAIVAPLEKTQQFVRSWIEQEYAKRK